MKGGVVRFQGIHKEWGSVWWRGYVETKDDPEWYVGTVWEDGSATFGKDREPRHFGSIYLAAQALEFYARAGGR